MVYVLWLKAGADGSRQAGDPTAHHIFMTLLLKAECDPSLKFDVRTINEARPPPEFKEAGLRHTPALQIAEDEGLYQLDDILQEADKFGPRFPVNQPAEDATADLFRQFAFFIKDVNKDEKALLGEFKRINDHLEAEGSSFLTGDRPTYLDCLMLPRIHSILIAAKYFKEFEVPPDLAFFWKYLKTGYDLNIFTTSSPCDQEIILHWGERPGVSLSASKKAQLSRQKANFTHTVPQ